MKGQRREGKRERDSFIERTDSQSTVGDNGRNESVSLSLDDHSLLNGNGSRVGGFKKGKRKESAWLRFPSRSTVSELTGRPSLIL